MNVIRYLVIAHRATYLWFWGLLALLFTVPMTSFLFFDHWIVGGKLASLWQLTGTQAPVWFMFVMGIMAATTRLPVAIANGATRRDFALGFGAFALISAILFGLVNLAGYGGEILYFRASGIMDKLTIPYPYPTVESVVRNMTAYLSLMLTGWLVGLLFHRLRIWLAIVLTLLAGLPLGIGSNLPIALDFPGGLGLSLLLVALAAIGSYLLVRTVPMKPRKA